MPIKSQIRLQQLTGSMVAIKTSAAARQGPGTVATATGSNVEDIFGYFGAAIQRIVGAASGEAFNQAVGTIASPGDYLIDSGDHVILDATHGLFVKDGGAYVLDVPLSGSAWTTSKIVDIKAVGSAESIHLRGNGNRLGVAGAKLANVNAGANAIVEVMSSGSSALAIKLNAPAGGIDASAATGIEFESTAGAFSVDVNNRVFLSGSDIGIKGESAAANAIRLEASAGGIDIDATLGGINVAAAAGPFTVDVNNRVFLSGSDIGLKGESVAANAIRLEASAGGIDIDAIGAISIDSSAGSIDMNVVDGQTVAIGLSGAAELVLSPHGTPANEKIALINTAGTADDAIKLDAVAGGLLLAAGDDSLHLDADGTDADALNIDSAGGMDVDVVGVLDMLAGDDSVIAVGTAAKDLALTVSGGGAQVLQLNSAGTGTDAIDINATAGGLDVDAAGAIAIDGTGISLDSDASSNFSTSIGSLTFVGANRTFVTGSDVGVKSTSTAVNSINIEASAGGMILSVPDQKGLSLGKAGGAEILISPHDTPAQEKILVENSAGTALDSVLLRSPGGVIASGSQVQLTGSDGVFFASHKDMTGDRIKLANTGDWTSFVGNALFGASTTIIGALNVLASAAGGGQIGYAVLTGSVSSPDPFSLNAASGFVNGNGYTQHTAFIPGEVNPANTQVYVNGQLLASSSNAAAPTTSGDYQIVRGVTGQIKFSFDLEEDDVVLIKTSAQQS